MLRHLDGCVLQATSVPTPRILQVKLTPEMLQQLLQSNGKDASITFDRAMEISIGDKQHAFSMVPETSTVEVYQRRKRDSSDMLGHLGTISQKLTVRRQLATNVSEKLKSRQAEEAAAKHERSVQTIEIDSKHKKPKMAVLSRSSTPMPTRPESPSRKSPFLQARKSPLLVASAAKPQTISLRSRIIQSLALGAIRDADLALRLKVPIDGVSQVLPEIAHKTGDSWVLDDVHYQGLKVWDWKGYTSAERADVISRASEAFDRLKLPERDLSRARLIHPEKRKTEERNDTSPLSLNTSTSTAATAVDVQKVSEKHNITTDKHEPTNLNLGAEKKSNARGILTTGKPQLEKKRKAEAIMNVSPPKPSRLRNTVADTISDTSSDSRPRTNKDRDISTASATQEMNHTSVPKKLTHTNKPVTQDDGQKLQHKPHSLNASKKERVENVQKSIDGSAAQTSQTTTQRSKTSGRTSQSPTKINGTSTESQTASAVSAKLAPPEKSPDLVDGTYNDRTASITSTSTDKTDRTSSSAISASTAPSSISSSPPAKAKPRSKFLTGKKAASQVSSVLKPGNNKAPATMVPPSSQKLPERKQTAEQSSAVLDQPSQEETLTLVSRKRKVPDDEATLSGDSRPKKRMQSIDLQNMARDYKRLYPEYRDLHAEVASKIGDSSLLNKFMEMHNQMSSWKQTLYAAESDYK